MIKVDFDPLPGRKIQNFRLSETMGGSKNTGFGSKCLPKMAFTLNFHHKDDFQTWVKYIFSESLPYTLHKSIIGSAQ